MTYPAANKTAQWFYGAVDTSPMGAVEKVVWHTTETTSWPSYSGGATAPHYTVKANFSTKRMEWRAHFPDTENARALQNDSGGVETNRDGALQVEIVGTCDESNSQPSWAYNSGVLRSWQLTDWQLQGLAEFVVYVCNAHDVPCSARSTWLAYNDTSHVAREDNGVRMSGSTWNGFRGHCGHQHVPENDHGDPGRLPIEAILSRAVQLLGSDTAPTPKGAPPMFIAWANNIPYLCSPQGKRQITPANKDILKTKTAALGAPIPDLGEPGSAFMSEFPTFDEAGTAAGNTYNDIRAAATNTSGLPASIAALQTVVTTQGEQIAELTQAVTDLVAAVTPPAGP